MTCTVRMGNVMNFFDFNIFYVQLLYYYKLCIAELGL